MKPKLLNLFSRREAVANSDPARECAVANAADIPLEESTGDEWFKISPYGVFPGSSPNRQQYFAKPQADAMVAEFNSWRGKLGRMFRGLPVYIGHPDVDPKTYPDQRRLGKIVDLRADADGLWGLPAWNDLGRQNQTEGYWIYPSPRWDAAAGAARFAPDRLLSIGLTNTPRIPTSEPVANAADAPSQNLQTDNEDIMRQQLLQKLGLPPEATDDEILSAIDKMQNEEKTEPAACSDMTEELADAKKKAADAESARASIACSLDTATSRVTELETEVASLRESAANSACDDAIRSGRITKAERADWHAKLTGDQREEAANQLSKLPPKLITRPLSLEESRMSVSGEKERRETVANAVDALMRDKSMTYHEAYLAVKRDPKFSAVFEGMQSPESA